MFRKTNKNCNNYEFTFDFNKKREHKIKRLNKNELLDVIIIGGGASGIAAANYLQQNGKKVIITETGWPGIGENVEAAEPSPLNAMKYFIAVQEWAKSKNIELFYFSSFDESWKTKQEGKVGAGWGIWDKNEKLKID